MRYHVIQHVSFETAGLLEEEIRSRGHSLRATALWDGGALPGTMDFDVLIVMGGPMSVHDEAEYPWLVAEKALIGLAIREGKKVLGICLGAQLIAEVCGGRVWSAVQKEIGWWPVRWVDGTKTVVFHWHGETFDLPVGAELLASTDICVSQAFRIGDRVLGIQFHPEVTEEIVRGMVGHEGWELAEAAGADVGPEGSADVAVKAGTFVQGAERILEGVREFGGQGIEWVAHWLGL